MDNKKDKLITEFNRLSGIPVNEGQSGVKEAVSMLATHLYHADNTIDSNKAFEVLVKNPGLLNLLPLGPGDVEALTHLSTVIKDNESNEKLQDIIRIVKSYVQ